MLLESFCFSCSFSDNDTGKLLLEVIFTPSSCGKNSHTWPGKKRNAGYGKSQRERQKGRLNISFKRGNKYIFTQEDGWGMKYLEKKGWVQEKHQKAAVMPHSFIGTSKHLLWSYTHLILSPSYPTHHPGLHRSFCQCLSNKYCVLYKLLSVIVGSQSHNLERILQQKLDSAGPVRCDPKRKRGAVTMWSQKEKWQITSIAHSESY